MTTSKHWVILFALCVSALLLFIHTRGFIPHDEGWIVNPSYRFLNGEIPYKDFHFIYFPGSLFLTTFLLSISPSILFLRLCAIVISLFSVFLIYKITYTISRKHMQAALSSVLYLIFGPLTINFIAPTMLAIPTALLTGYFLFIKQTPLFIFYAGISSALTMLFKQNFGAAIVLTSLLGILFLKQNRFSSLKLYILGFLLGWLPILLVLFSIGGIHAFLTDIYYFTIEKTLEMKLQVTPFIYPGSSLFILPKALFYLSPLLLSLIAMILSFQKNKSFFLLSLFTGSMYLFGIRPTTDYVHLAPLLTLLGIPLTIIYMISKTRIQKILITGISLAFIGLGVYTLATLHYYRWEDPIVSHNTFSYHPRVSIFVNNKSYESINELQSVIEEKSLTGENIFIYDYLPMFYFLTDTRNPTQFDFFPPLTEDDRLEILRDLASKDVPLVVTTGDITRDTTLIGNYIKRNYRMKKLTHFYIWEKNS